MQLNDKNTTISNTTTAAVDVPITYNVQLVEKGVVSEDRQQQRQEREPENILSETAAVVVQRQSTQVDHSFTCQINNNNDNNNWIQQEKDVTMPTQESTLLTTNSNDKISFNNAKTAATQTDNTHTGCMENSTSQKTDPVSITRSTQTIVTMGDIIYALLQQEQQQQLQEQKQQEQQQHNLQQRQQLQEQLREKQREQSRQKPRKAIIKHKVKYVEIPENAKIFHTEPVNRGRQPIVIPASEDEYPLVPIDSSDSEWDNGEDIPYNPPIIDQEEPITPTPTTTTTLISKKPAERIETSVNNNRVKRLVHNNDDVQKSKNKRFKKSSGSSSSVQKTDLRPSTEVAPTKLVRFFCPYEGCSTSMVMRSKLFEHIQNLHDPRFHMPKYPCVLKTLSGRDIDLENGNSRNLVKRGEKICVVRAGGASTEGFYCPYKRCFSCRPFSRLTSLYRHLRGTHHLNVPKEKHKHLSFTFRTFSGRILKFEENSRNALDDKEQVLVDVLYKYKSVPKVKKENGTTKDENYHCPYKNCAYKRSTGRNEIYKHIRRAHDRQFLPSSCGRKFILTNSQGKVISDLDEHSINSINIDERIKVFRGAQKKK